MAEVILNKENFETEVIKAEGLVLVDFWASWCGPCKMLSPIVADIAENNSDKVKVCKINIDDEEELSDKYGIVSIPTLYFFKNGEVVDKSIGLVSKNDILQIVEKHI